MKPRILLAAVVLAVFLATFCPAQETVSQKKTSAPAPPKSLQSTMAPGYTIPVVDISGEKERQVIVDREPGQYLGHPTTVLLEDGRTMLIVYPKGHGRGAIVYKRSNDGGLTWSERLPTPPSWATSLEVPTLHRVVDAAGKKRVVLFSGLYPIRMAVTEDDGATWSELKPIGEFGGVVTMATVIELKTGPGHYLAFFHDDGRFIRGGNETRYTMKSPHSDHTSPAAKPWRFWVYTTLSQDGGLTWSVPAPIAMLPDADQARLGDFSCGEEGWAKHVAEWIRGSDMVNSLKRGTRVWLFETQQGEIVGVGSLGISRWRWPPPDGAVTTIVLIPMLGVDRCQQGQPPEPEWRFALFRCGSRSIFTHIAATKLIKMLTGWQARRRSPPNRFASPAAQVVSAKRVQSLPREKMLCWYTVCNMNQTASRIDCRPGGTFLGENRRWQHGVRRKTDGASR